MSVIELFSGASDTDQPVRPVLLNKDETAPATLNKRRIGSICVGVDHGCAIFASSQRVKCWGSSQFGQTGYNSTRTRGSEAGELDEWLPLVELGAGALATQLACGAYHTCVVLTTGRVKCFGRNDVGQLVSMIIIRR